MKLSRCCNSEIERRIPFESENDHKIEFCKSCGMVNPRKPLQPYPIGALLSNHRQATPPGQSRRKRNKK